MDPKIRSSHEQSLCQFYCNAGYAGIIFKPIISYKQHCFLNRKRLCIVAWFVRQKLKVLRLLGGLDESSLRAGLLLQAQAGQSFAKLS